MKKQKFFSRNIVIALALIALLAGGVLYAAKPAEAKAHTHSYRWVVKKAASCTSEGYRNYECACGSCINSQTIPRTPHTYDRSSPTCTAARKCIYCGYVIQGALGHRWNRTTANCTAAKSCTRCGVVAEPARGHSMQWVCITPANCTTNGQKVYRCIDCGFVGQTETIPCYGHHFDIPTATCTQDRRCTSCGYVVEPARGHNWNRSAATCTEDKKCTRCGKIDQKATGVHNWVVDHTEPATCTESGHTYYCCSYAGCTETKVEDTESPTGHKYSWVVTTQPTKSVIGVESHKCANCTDVDKTRKLYLISYDRNGGNSLSMPADQIKRAGVSLKLSSVVPTRSNYIFKGWGTNKTDVTYQPGDSYTKNAKVTLYAIWEPRTFRVEFNANGGYDAPDTQYKVYGESLRLSDKEPRRTGYTFLGWSTSSTATTESWKAGGLYTRESDTVLYAVWTKQKITVAYELNGGQVTNVKAFEAKTYEYGATVSVNTEGPTRSGYQFKGWTDSRNSITVKYGPGGQFTAIQDTTLYAIWEQRGEYRIVFHFPDSIDHIVEKYYEYGTEITMPGPDYNIPGEESIVWHLEKVVGSEGLTWRDGEAFIVMKDMEFYGEAVRDDHKQATHDFTGFTQVSGLKNESFIASETPGDSNDYGFNQSYFGSDRYEYGRLHRIDLAWEMYITKNPNRVNSLKWDFHERPGLKEFLQKELDLATYNRLVAFMEEKFPTNYYDPIDGLIYLVIDDHPYTEIFAAIDLEFKDGRAVSRAIKKYYGQEYEDYISGSCGIFAALNTYLYLSGNGRIFSADTVLGLFKEYIRMTGGAFDWLERDWSHGDGIVSICTFLQNKLSSRGCNATWWWLSDAGSFDSYACYNKIKSLLNQDIPVIMSFYRHDGTELSYYAQNGNTLKESEVADQHYFVVTGVYENPNCPNKHFLEISTWGRKRYICYEEYVILRGVEAFSTIMDITLN